MPSAGSSSAQSSTARSSLLVAAGIFLSRAAGLIRDRMLAHYFGNSDAADAFRAALRIPNFLQNLFGEGVLSASFIPVYARLLSQGEAGEASRVAGVVGALLSVVTTTLAVAGMWASPVLIDVIAPGFLGDKRLLTINLVRILFPGTALLVMSAWCLGILNSHKRFLLSYAAPVIWNAAIVAALIFYGPHEKQAALAVKVAWGAVAGSALQVLVQLPQVLRLARGLRIARAANTNVSTVVNNFGNVFVGRGVVQISAYIDSLLASLLPTGAVSALAYAQTLYTLPVSLFGMSVSAAELPAMSGALGTEIEIAAQLRERLNAGLQRIAFFVIPSAVAFVALGDVIAGAIYQSGKFGKADAVYVWGILAGSSVGLLASTMGRLYSSAYYALRDSRTPLRYAVIRVALTTVLGYLCAIPLPRILGIDAKWGVAGLTASAGVAGWIEFALLRHGLNPRIGLTGLPIPRAFRLWIAALAGASAGWAVKFLSINLGPILKAALVLPAFGLVFLGVALVFGIPQAKALARGRYR